MLQVRVIVLQGKLVKCAPVCLVEEPMKRGRVFWDPFPTGDGVGEGRGGEEDEEDEDGVPVLRCHCTKGHLGLFLRRLVGDWSPSEWERRQDLYDVSKSGTRFFSRPRVEYECPILAT